MKEVELLYKLNTEKERMLKDNLKDFFVEDIVEKDVYLYPPHKDYVATNEGRENLRIRVSGGHKEICYKKVVYKNGFYSHSIEKNAKIDDDKSMLDILIASGFHVHFKITKQRSIYQDTDFKYTIDKVENLGLFLEIEKLECGKDESEDQQNIINKAKEFGLTEIQTKGYLRLLEEQI